MRLYRNGMWRLMDADENGSGGTAPVETVSEETADTPADEPAKENQEDLKAELERMKSEMAKQKAAMDKATKEAGDLRKELRSKMTQEQIDAANKQEAEEKAAKELEELRKEVAKGKTIKSVMSKLGADEDAAGKISDYLYGAEDIENAMLLIQKIWNAREKALKLEYGKIPGPGAGSGEGENSAEQRAIERAKNLGRERAENSKTVAEGLNGYIR